VVQSGRCPQNVRVTALNRRPAMKTPALVTRA